MVKKNNRSGIRITVVACFFCLVCVVYAIRMISIQINAEPVKKKDDTYKREEVIEAVRGEIYDRNGKALVSNVYSYDFILDYEAMSADRIERNMAILQSVYALYNTNNYDKRTESSFPFEGSYPEYRYSAQARDTESNIYYRLLKRIAADELEDESPKKKNELTADYLDKFYADHPESFPDESEIFEFFAKRYKLTQKNPDGSDVFSDSEKDILFRALYDMEVADFSSYYPFTMARDVDLSLMTYVNEIHIVGSNFKLNSKRVYNYPGYASHILGSVGSITSENWEYYKELGYSMSDTVGTSGCEYAFEEYLRGINGTRVIVEDSKGNIIDSYVKTEPVAGKDVYLTIDIDLQIATEESLALNIKEVKAYHNPDANSGAAIAIDPNNGEILALASYPTYNLATLGADYSSLIANPANPLYNRAINGLYAPGSTFKVGMVAAGISSGEITPSDLLPCNGVYTYYNDYQPKCWIYPSYHGNINAVEAIRVSCNCYFYELGRRMGIEKMNMYCTTYGLGQVTGLEISSKTGVLAGPDYREQVGGTAWTAGNTISAAIGQADNLFSPLQLSVYISTILNGGTRYSAHLLKEVRGYSDTDGIQLDRELVLGTSPLSSFAVSTVKEGMRQMVASSSTAASNMKNIPVIVGGKTGTAQLGGNIEENGLFVCAAPYDKPEIVVATIIEHAGGGSYSIPSAAGILEAYYGVE